MHWYGGLGVSLGDSKAWKPQKVGAAGGLGDTNGAHSGPFLAILGPFLGHIAELEGNKGLFVTGQSRRTWSAATTSLRLST